MLNFDSLITYIETLGDQVVHRTAPNAEQLDNKTYQVIIEGITKSSLGLLSLPNYPPSTPADAIQGEASTELLTAADAITAITSWLSGTIPLSGYGLIEITNDAGAVTLHNRNLVAPLRFAETAEELANYKAASNDPIMDVLTNTYWTYSVDTWYSSTPGHAQASPNSLYFQADPRRAYIRGDNTMVKLHSNADASSVLAVTQLNVFPSHVDTLTSIDVLWDTDYSGTMNIMFLALADYLGQFS